MLIRIEQIDVTGFEKRFAKLSDISELKDAVKEKASQSELNLVREELKTKLERTALEDINASIDTKLDKQEFYAIRDEVIQARKNKINLNERLNDLEFKLSEIIAAQASKTKGIQIGSVVWFTGSEAPDHFAICDGSAISRDEYPDLFLAIGTSYGEGNGFSTFNLPNLLDEERFIRSSGGNIRLGLASSENLTDVRESYEGKYNMDKLYLVGGKYFTEEAVSSMEPNSVTMLPCIKIKEEPTADTSIGLFNWFTNEELPEDYLECDGRAVSRSQYSELFNIIGTKYGVGDGNSTFNLPNLTTDNRYIKSSLTVGTIKNSKTTLTDVRQAYEGESNGDKFMPLGASYFSTQVEESDIVPPAVALVPGIKVKKDPKLTGTPIGGFTWFAGGTEPFGYLICDGSEVSRMDYSELFEAIGTTFGEGDGRSTFNLPNMLDSNKFIRARGGRVPLGDQAVLKLGDIRNAYEGEYNSDKLYPIGSKGFTGENLFTGIHPNNFALMPCIKAKEVEKFDIMGSIRKLDTMMTRMSMETKPSAPPETEIEKVSVHRFNINTTLRAGRATVTIPKDKIYKIGRVASCFVSVNNTSKGERYICDIIANPMIKHGEVIIYIRSLLAELNDANIELTAHVL